MDQFRFTRLKAGFRLIVAAAALIAFGLALTPSPAATKASHGGGAAQVKAKAGTGKSVRKIEAGGKAAGKDAASKSQTPAVPEPAEAPPPYEPKMMRLAEILGALSYLGEVCGEAEAPNWRARMQAVLEADPNSSLQKERLAGLFNRSFRGYERSYQICTPNAQAAITRFLLEGGNIAHELVSRYGAS
jgi:uncharacterized protein (TIGR02301 family)